MPFLQSPKVLKGSLVRLDDEGEPAQVVSFQYNPEKLLRKIEERGGVDGETRSARGPRAPREHITCSLMFDATDALEHPDENPNVVEKGISPMLAALEILMYQRERRSPRWWKFWRSGASSGLGPLSLFIWGANRVIPVRLERLDVTEEQHDPELRPIRATVAVTMRVVAEEDLPPGHKGIHYCRMHVSALEALASEGYSMTPPITIKDL